MTGELLHFTAREEEKKAAVRVMRYYEQVTEDAPTAQNQARRLEAGATEAGSAQAGLTAARPAPRAGSRAVETQSAEIQSAEIQPVEVKAPEFSVTEQWTVDGIEDSPHGPLARLEREDGSTFDLPVRMLPGGLREGDLLAVHDGPDGATARILVGETMTRHEAMQARLDTLNSAGNDDLDDDDGEITV